MILERLKTETRPHHDAIEKVSFSDKIMSGTLTLDEYKLLIANNYILHAVMENALEQVPAFTALEGLDFDKRKKTATLAKDLEVLGLDKAALDNHAYTYSFNNVHEALGSFYVLEGSTLGGAVIARTLAKNPNLTGVPSYNFYGCYGDMVGPMWKQFQQTLLATATDEQKETEMVQSASKTFDFFRGIFEDSLAARA